MEGESVCLCVKKGHIPAKHEDDTRFHAIRERRSHAKCKHACNKKLSRSDIVERTDEKEKIAENTKKVKQI